MISLQAHLSRHVCYETPKPKVYQSNWMVYYIEELFLQIGMSVRQLEGMAVELNNEELKGKIHNDIS